MFNMTYARASNLKSVNSITKKNSKSRQMYKLYFLNNSHIHPSK